MRSMHDAASEVIDALMSRTDDRRVVVGPVSWKGCDCIGVESTWYFMVENGAGLAIIALPSESEQMATQTRDAFVSGLCRRRPLLTLIEVVDSDVKMARVVNAMWPSPEHAERLALYEAGDDR